MKNLFLGYIRYFVAEFIHESIVFCSTCTMSS